MFAKFLRKIGRAQWVNTTCQETGNHELAFRIFGVNFIMYKDHKPLIAPTQDRWRPIRKREYGETLRPA